MISVPLCTVKSRSSHWRCSVRKGVLRNFSTFTGKHLWGVPFLIKLGLSLQLYKKFLRTPFLQDTSGRLLLQIHVTLCSTYLLNDKNYNTRFLTICFYKLSLVRLIYFCQFSDFKLQRNEAQTRNITPKHA